MAGEIGPTSFTTAGVGQCFIRAREKGPPGVMRVVRPPQVHPGRSHGTRPRGTLGALRVNEETTKVRGGRVSIERDRENTRRN